MNTLSSKLKWRDLVAMGLYVGNMLVNMEASPIEATETAHVMSLVKGITRPGFGPQVELQMLMLFLKIDSYNHVH